MPILTGSRASAGAFEPPVRLDGSNAWFVGSARRPGRPLSSGCSTCGDWVRAPQVAPMQAVTAAFGMASAHRRAPRRTGAVMQKRR